MSKKEPPDAEDALDIASVAEPAPGAPLSRYVEYLTAFGQVSVMSADGTHAWVPGARGELLRLPMLCTTPPDPAEVRRLLRERGVWIVSYLLADDEAHPANGFAYLCRSHEYVIDDLPGKVRNKIRRGLRTFTIRLCTPDELIDNGYVAEVDTANRHGHAVPDRKELTSFVERRRDAPFFDLWGAWDGGDLAAWMCVLRIDDWALIEMGRSCTKSLKLAPNNALRYVATRKYMLEDRLAYFQSGVSSIQPESSRLSLHDYKRKMGFEPVPFCRTFVLHPVLAPLMKSPMASWTLEKLSAARPSSLSLQKAAGMSRLLSGREKSPLSWAEEQAD